MARPVPLASTTTPLEVLSGQRLRGRCPPLIAAGVEQPRPSPSRSNPVDPNYDVPMNLPGYQIEARVAKPEQIAQVAAAIKRSKRPVIYAGAS